MENLKEIVESLCMGRWEGSEAEIRVNNEDLLPTVQVDDETWSSASGPIEQEGVDSKDRFDCPWDFFFFGCVSRRRGVFTDLVFQLGYLA